MKRRKDSTYKISDLISLFMIFGWLLFAWTYTYDTDTPLGSDSPAVIDDRIRETKDAIQERQNIDHYWPLTGTEVSDADAGKHRQITFQAPIATTPTVAESQGDLRIKDFSGKAEFTWTDEDENELQITSVGKIVGNLTDDSVGAGEIQIANNTYLVAANAAGTAEVNLIKAGTNDLATLPDSAEMASNAAPVEDEAIANKKYVDDQDSFSAWTNEDSDSAAMLKTHAYLAASDGFVNWTATPGTSKNVQGFVDTDSDPASGGTRVSYITAGGGTAHDGSFAVAEGEYFELTTDGSAAITIFWKSVGTLSKPVDQD